MSDPSSAAIRRAAASDVAACVRIRGRTRENAISREQLAAYGITEASWRQDVQTGALLGWVCEIAGETVGYCFGVRGSGEIAVLALLPAAEGQGLGRQLLHRTVQDLQALGFERLFLGCSADPASRSYGFYRHLGWRSTGQRDAHGDEVLELWPTEDSGNCGGAPPA